MEYSSYNKEPVVEHTKDNVEYTKEQMLEAIHECVYGSTVRHVITLPAPIIVEYLATFPFYRGADVLYYLLLKKLGSVAHYTYDGRHLVTINPELLGVYVTAGQDTKALIQRHKPDETIYSLIAGNITRTVTCQRYQMRNSIIIEEAPFDVASQIPSIALNLPKYQAIYHTGISSGLFYPNVSSMMIDYDCLEALSHLAPEFVFPIIGRMGVLKGIYPNLWNIILKKYYTDQLTRLKIHDMLPQLATKLITCLNTLLPDLIKLPLGHNTLCVRLWFTSRHTRAYLLGFDLNDGYPTDEIISERLRHLQKIGIENYANEITGIKIDENNLLTGRIGMITYPSLGGKKLANNKDTVGTSLNLYYPYDLIHLIHDDNVSILSMREISTKLKGAGMIDLFTFDNLLNTGHFPQLLRPLTQQEVNMVYKRYTLNIGTKCGLPARTKLVEMMSNDVVNQ